MKKLNTTFLAIIALVTILILICLLLILNYMGVISIWKNENKKIYTTYIDITYDEYEQKINNNEDFILFIYQTNCSHCKSFEPKLNEVIEKYNLEVYALNIENITDIQYEKLKNKTFVTGTPTTVIFQGGKKKDRLSGNKDKAILIQFLESNDYIKEK